MLCTTATNTSNTIRTQTGAAVSLIQLIRILPTAEFEIQWRLTWPTHTYLIRSQHYNNSINTLLINKCIVFSALSFSKQKQTKTSTTPPVRVLPAKRSSVSSRNRSVFVSGGDYGRFVPMHFRSRERNDQLLCSFPGTNMWTFRSRNETAYSNFRALERLSEPNEEKE